MGKNLEILYNALMMGISSLWLYIMTCIFVYGGVILYEPNKIISFVEIITMVLILLLSIKYTIESVFKK